VAALAVAGDLKTRLGRKNRVDRRAGLAFPAPPFVMNLRPAMLPPIIGLIIILGHRSGPGDMA